MAIGLNPLHFQTIRERRGVHPIAMHRDITSHYSAPEIEELLAAANRVCEVNPRKIPALTILKRKTG